MNVQTFSDYILKAANRSRLVAVIGSRFVDDSIYQLAEEVGKEIAVRGGMIICGGLGGVMEAACKGAKSANGVTIGILPGISIDEANKYVDIPIATGMGMARNAIIAHSGRVAIAVDGKYGTLSEIGFFKQLNKHVIGLQSWDVPNIESCDDPKSVVEKAFEYIV